MPRSRKRHHQGSKMLFFDEQDSQIDNGTFTDDSVGGAGSQQPLRAMNVNTYGAQQNSRQASRLQNSQKTGLGNGSAGSGWAFGGGPAGGFGGFGGLGGAPGLGAARPGQLSGFAQIMGGGGQNSIDMNDFPSLAGPARQQQNPGGWNSNVIRQPQQAQPQQPQSSAQPHRAPSTAPSHQSIDQFDGSRSQTATDRGAANDDYQSMSGQTPVTGESGRQNGFGSSVLGSPSDSNPPSVSQQSQLPVRDPSSSFPPNSQAPVGSGQPTPPAQTMSQQSPARLSNGPSGETAPAPAVKKWADMTEREKWGMAGLNAIFEARRQSETGGQIDETLPPHIRNTAVIMGQDLNTLGMDLDSPEDLHPTFSVWPSQHPSDSIFNYRDHHPVPAFQVPPAYTVTNVPPMQTRMGAFSDETLLQIFFQMPRDVMQELAATELSLRDWRWHKVIRQWLQKDTREANAASSLPISDLTNGIPIGQPAVRLDERSERGVYIFFDHNNWRRQRREFTLHYDELHVNSIPAAVGGSNGSAPAPAQQAGGFGGMAGMQGGPVGGQPERQNSGVSGAT